MTNNYKKQWSAWYSLKNWFKSSFLFTFQMPASHINNSVSCETRKHLTTLFGFRRPESHSGLPHKEGIINQKQFLLRRFCFSFC